MIRLSVTVTTEEQAADLRTIATANGWKVREHKRAGRKPITDRPGFAASWAKVAPAIHARRISLREAAERLGIGVATVKRLRDAEAAEAGKQGDGKRRRR